MPFDQSTITSAKGQRDDADLLITWASSSPDGTMYQVYVDRVLAWSGTALSATVGYPGQAGRVEVDIGTVATAEAYTDFSGSLPSLPWANHALLTWVGGSYESPTLAGFHVYQGATAGASVSYAKPVGTVTAYPQGVVSDGWGQGGWGLGGWGESSASYSWESGVLTGGAWHFGVKPYDSAGNEGTTVEWIVTITAPPRPVAPNAAGQRVTLTYNVSTHKATLNWLASPG